ncbi:MAG TPA: hypothetical protein ENK57_21925 [Polyangiaceae bacterium]|nr:hypothetical protein [Polyangiaceae bacterium]
MKYRPPLGCDPQRLAIRIPFAVPRAGRVTVRLARAGTVVVRRDVDAEGKLTKRIGMASFDPSGVGLVWHAHELTDVEREMIEALVATSRRALAPGWFLV